MPNYAILRKVSDKENTFINKLNKPMMTDTHQCMGATLPVHCTQCTVHCTATAVARGIGTSRTEDLAPQRQEILDGHRRRMERKAKAKVVESVWG